MVDGEQLKQAYLKLTPPERRDVAHWILARELSGRAGATLQQAPKQPFLQPFTPVFPKAMILLAALTMFCLLGLAALYWKGAREEADRSAVARSISAEASRPHSPTNLAFLASNVGREITIQGIPKDHEVGYLYFDVSHRNALRLNLFSGGVVVLQSGELERLVREQKQIEVVGLLEKTEDGYYQLNIPSGRLRILNP